MNKVYKITAKVEFPEGVAPGAGSSSNRQVIAKNGRGEFVLRGSAFAGVLRTAYAAEVGVESGDEDVVQWFGAGFDGDFDNSSIVQVADAVIGCKSLNERTHNMTNRHTGAVAKGALFSLEAIPPMADAHLSITLKPGGYEAEQYMEFVSDLVELLGNDLFVGGSSNRGIGRMKVAGDVYLRTFDLDTVEGIADFMDAEYRERKSGAELTGVSQEVPENKNRLEIDLELGIPRGEDLLVGDGQEADYALKPQSVTFVDGINRWRIPGSSLRGIFRGWMTRLAVRDGAEIRDSVEQWYDLYDDASAGYKPDLAGWGFIEKKNREKYQKKPDLLNDPILDLFGSMYKKGRIHIADSFSQPADRTDVQERMHVAVDRFAGGANEGALFNNLVLAGKNLKFSSKIFITRPTENELKWLIKTLRALHFGILHVGSSKSSGRLEIKSISAKGPGSEAVTVLAQELK